MLACLHLHRKGWLPRGWPLQALPLIAALASPAFAAPPPHAGGPQQKQEREAHGGGAPLRDNVGQGDRVGRQPLKPGAYIGERHRSAVRDYYAQHYGAGKRCPPGLAKKGNGCQAPGQTKHWQIGERLPATVALRPVPPPVLAQLPKTPPGHRYVTIAGDILLIATGSRMVVDGIHRLLEG